jgi:hypothetical protein
MTNAEAKAQLDEITGVFVIAQSSFNVLEYLAMTTGGIEGYIITNNSFLRTSIFAYWRVAVLELSKLFPNTGDDANNHFSVRKIIDDLKTKTTLLTAPEIDGLEKEETSLRNEETRLKEKIIKSIKTQRDKKIAHTDKDRFSFPDGLSLENLFTMLHGCEIMINFLNKKINGVDFSTANINEPVTHLQTMVELLAEIKRKEVYQKLKEAQSAGIAPDKYKEYGVNTELIVEDRNNIVFKKMSR